MSKISPVALYARVSSERQAREHTIDSQVAALKERLAREGYEILEAATAAAALEQAGTGVDLILLDFRLPDSADLRLLEKVRGLTPTAQVIMITAHNSPELTLGAEALGAYRVVSKPFEVESMAALVKQARDQSTKS